MHPILHSHFSLPNIHTYPILLVTKMCFENVSSQKEWFYRKPWNKELDQAFIDTLIGALGGSPELGNDLPGEALVLVKDNLNARYGLKLVWEDAYSKFTLLRRRYDTFRWLLSVDGVSWDRTQNYVFTTDDVWKYAFKVCYTHFIDNGVGVYVYAQLNVHASRPSP